MREDTEEICLNVSAHAKAGLFRLANFYNLTQAEVFEKVIEEADSDAADEAFKSGGSMAQKAYYDTPKPWG